MLGFGRPALLGDEPDDRQGGVRPDGGVIVHVQDPDVVPDVAFHDPQLMREMVGAGLEPGACPGSVVLRDNDHPHDGTALGEGVDFGHRLAPLLCDHVYAEAGEMTGEMRAERDDGALESRVGVMPADGRDDDYELVMQARIHVARDVVDLPYATPCEEHAVH